MKNEEFSPHIIFHSFFGYFLLFLLMKLGSQLIASLFIF